MEVSLGFAPLCIVAYFSEFRGAFGLIVSWMLKHLKNCFAFQSNKEGSTGHTADSENKEVL